MARRPIRGFLAVIGLCVVAMVAAAPARAHIQVTPTEVSPADPVLFTVLVPGETAAGTTRVELKVPTDTFPFSFEETPGWERKLIKNPNGLIDRIVWTGKAKPDGLLRFTFLAGTPEKPITIKWPAIQTYADGEVANWIGSPESENPAPVTEVTESAPRQNAGGEGRETSGDQQSSSKDVPTNADDESDNDWLTTGAAFIGLVLGLAAFTLVLIDRRRRRN